MTHAEQEQQLLAYLLKYRATLNLTGLATAVGLADATPFLKFVTQQRGLSADVLASCQAYLKQQAEDLQLLTFTH